MIQRAILLVDQQQGRDKEKSEFGPLVEVNGCTLIQRCLLSLDQGGIHDVVIIAGTNGKEIQRQVEQDLDIATTITWVSDPNWSSSDVKSFLQVRSYVEDPTLLLRANLVFGPEVVAPLVDHPFESHAAVLVDRKLSGIFALNNVVKARTDGSHVLEIGYHLPQYDAVAVGIGVITPVLFNFLLEESGDNIALAFSRLAKSGAILAQDINGAQWQKVDSPETLSHAEWLLRVCGNNLDGEAISPRSRLAGRPHSERTLSYIEGLLSENRARHYVLLNPGPVLTSPRVKSALVHHDICHRDDDYAAVVRRVKRKLRRVCRGGPEHDVLLFSGSGTAAMEATLSTFVPEKRKLLIVSNGAFGERFAEIAKVHNIETVHVRYDWGKLVDPKEVEHRLEQDEQIVAVAMCHHETSVGILNPVHEIGSICKKHECMFFVDTISSLGAEDVNVRRDNIDVLISSANKCLHAISGVSFICMNSEIWSQADKTPKRSYYLDLRHYQNDKIPFTPAVSNIMALDIALDDLLRESISGRMARYEELNRRIRAALQRMGLVQFTNTGHESHTITTVAVPPYIIFSDLYATLKKRGYIIYACKEPLVDRYFQIANMGELEDEMVQGFLDALAMVLRQAALQKQQAPVVHASAR